MIQNTCLALCAMFITAASAIPAQESLTSASAVKLLGLKGDGVHTTRAVWNGVPTVFVDYPTGRGDQAELVLVAVQRMGTRLRRFQITVGEQEGGIPEVAAIGFANADHDARKELIVILQWSQVHYDVGGTLYEVRLFDDLKPGQPQLMPLARLSRHFGSECECSWRDGSSRRFRFKTVAAVRRELSRMGY